MTTQNSGANFRENIANRNHESRDMSLDSVHQVPVGLGSVDSLSDARTAWRIPADPNKKLKEAGFTGSESFTYISRKDEGDKDDKKPAKEKEPAEGDKGGAKPGNTTPPVEGDKKALTPAQKLLKQLDDDDFDVREAGSEKLNKLLKENISKPKDDLNPLMKVLKSDDMPEVKYRVERELSALAKDPKTMLAMLGHQNEGLREWAIDKLGKSPNLNLDLAKLAPLAEQGNENLRDSVRKAADLVRHDLDRGFTATKGWDDLRDASWKFSGSRRELDFSKMTKEDRDKAIKTAVDTAESLVKSADKISATDEATLARIVFPEKDRIPGSAWMGQRLAGLAGRQRIDMASELVDVAAKFKEAGGDKGTVDRIQAIAATYMKEGLANAGEYGKNAYFHNTLRRIEKLNPEKFAALVPNRIVELDPNRE